MVEAKNVPLHVGRERGRLSSLDTWVKKEKSTALLYVNCKRSLTPPGAYGTAVSPSLLPLVTGLFSRPRPPQPSTCIAQLSCADFSSPPQSSQAALGLLLLCQPSTHDATHKQPTYILTKSSSSSSTKTGLVHYDTQVLLPSPGGRDPHHRRLVGRGQRDRRLAVAGGRRTQV